MVEPLGDVLMKLLPDGLRALLAPAVALPALELPPLAAPVVVPRVVDPVAGAPPVPLLCAKAAPPANASAAANPTAANLIDQSPRVERRGTNGRTANHVPALAKTLEERRAGARFRERLAEP
jgi:hypothetical protein